MQKLSSILDVRAYLVTYLLSAGLVELQGDLDMGLAQGLAPALPIIG